MPKCRVKRHSVTQPSDPSIRLIPLTQRQNAIVDASDYEWLMQWNWCAHKRVSSGSFYAERVETQKGKRKTIHMASVVLGCGPREADHIDRNPLNNRRDNLRKCSMAENSYNRMWRRIQSRFKGIARSGSRWRARIKLNGKMRSLGSFGSEEEAARAYDSAARITFGQFALLNFPPTP